MYMIHVIGKIDFVFCQGIIKKVVILEVFLDY